MHVCTCAYEKEREREREEAVHCFVSLVMTLKEFITEMFVIIHPQYSLQEANAVSLMTKLEVKVGRRVPSREVIESLLSTCLCTLILALQFILSQVWSKPTPAVCAVLLGLHPSPGHSDTQPFISWLGYLLIEKKELFSLATTATCSKEAKSWHADEQCKCCKW